MKKLLKILILFVVGLGLSFADVPDAHARRGRGGHAIGGGGGRGGVRRPPAPGPRRGGKRRRGRGGRGQKARRNFQAQQQLNPNLPPVIN